MRKLKFVVTFSLMAVIVNLSYSQKESKRTSSGYDYYTINSEKGEASKRLDYVSFTIRIVGDDRSVLQEMGEGPNMPVIQLKDSLTDEEAPNPLIEALLSHRVGDSIVLTMPIDSMPQVPVDLQNMKFIKYEMKIIKIQNKTEFEKAQDVLNKEREAAAQASMAKMPAIEKLVKNTITNYKAGKLKTQISESGLKYIIINEGTGTNAVAGQLVSVQYYGALIDGKMFDNSFSRGQAITFPLGKQQVIKGWDEGIALLNKGTKAFLFIPSQLGYGENGQSGAIPPYAELVFYVELEDIN